MTLADFQPIGDTGAMVTDNQAAAALANVAVYADRLAYEIATKAAARGPEYDDELAFAALKHIVELTSEAAVSYAKDIGDTLRHEGFKRRKQPAYHVMSAEQAGEVEGAVRLMALAGALPEVGQ